MPEKNSAPAGMASPREEAIGIQASSKSKQAMILAFVNQKGGTGKTTIAQNLAVCFALLHKQRVLCVDLDPQGNFGQGLLSTPISTTKTADRLLLVPKATVAEYIMPLRPGVDLIPNRFQRELHEGVDRLPICGQALRKQLSQVTAQYDYILIDTPAGLCKSTGIGIDAADQVIIVVSCGKYALRGMSVVIDWMSENSTQLGKGMPHVKVVLNNFDERRRYDREFKREVEYIFGEDLYQTQIRTTIRIVEASAQAKAVVELGQLNTGATDFSRLSREMLGLPQSAAPLAEANAENEPQPRSGLLKLVS
jgi:cellulose biosynthesis protein BcsQ